MSKRSVTDWRPLEDRRELGPMFDNAALRRWTARRRRTEARAQTVFERAVTRAWRPWLDKIIAATGLPVQDGDVPYCPLGSQFERSMPPRQALCLALRDAVKLFVAHRAWCGEPTLKMQSDAFNKIEVSAQRLIEALGCQPAASPPALPDRHDAMPGPWGRSLLGALADADPDIWAGEAPGTVPIVFQSGLVDAATEDADAWIHPAYRANSHDDPHDSWPLACESFPVLGEADRSVREAIAAVKALHRWAAAARCEAEERRKAAERDDGTDRGDPALDELLVALDKAYLNTFGEDPGFCSGSLNGEVGGRFSRFVAATMCLLLPSEPLPTHAAIRARWRRATGMAT